ncbi:hypothetical protein AAC387_Pa01g1851 [Persea americana]
MKQGSPKTLPSIIPFSKPNPSILRSVVVIAVCVFFASWFFISNLSGSLVKSYPFGAEVSRKSEVLFLNPNRTVSLLQPNSTLKNVEEDSSTKWNSSGSLRTIALPLLPPSSFDTIQEVFNDSSNVDSGVHDDNTVPSNSTFATSIISSSNASKIDPCKS